MTEAPKKSDNSQVKKANIFMALDLEMAQPSNRIIEVGICFANLDTEEVFGAKSLYVNPHELLTPYIINLTGITQETVDAGMTLEAAYDIVKADCEANLALTQGRVLTWGHGDVHLFKSQLDVGINSGELFGRRYIDVKTLFQAWRLSSGQSMQGGLAKSLTKLGLKFEGQKHSAAHDAVNTARIFFALLKKFVK